MHDLPDLVDAYHETAMQRAYDVPRAFSEHDVYLAASVFDQLDADIRKALDALKGEYLGNRRERDDQTIVRHVLETIAESYDGAPICGTLWDLAKRTAPLPSDVRKVAQPQTERVAA